MLLFLFRKFLVERVNRWNDGWDVHVPRAPRPPREEEGPVRDSS